MDSINECSSADAGDERLSTIKLLVSSGADVNRSDADGNTPTHILATTSEETFLSSDDDS